MGEENGTKEKRCTVCQVPIKSHMGPYGPGRCAVANDKDTDGVTTPLTQHQPTLTAMQAQIDQLSQAMLKLTTAATSRQITDGGQAGASAQGPDISRQQSLLIPSSSTGETRTSSVVYGLQNSTLSNLGLYDPRHVLTIKARTKPLHITEFLSETTKQRIKSKRQKKKRATSRTSFCMGTDKPFP